ncbi:uncharacterized protein BDW43DRAFT_310569 [Aspergillus alliaceus]|uniref:uncharacterized protein n=1 Tax=Petromyces alliaceus TaxID=209559 RepID=UPI0012A6543D|nr:uncharacterized protein BDW43DRAFT_310569 [Aspergillus alliaceus]KAB8234215.1 hypothetical protein BDW43DRAFT_310569 [Aspergillus alliaceus]
MAIEDWLVSSNFLFFFGPRRTAYVRVPGARPKNRLPASLAVHSILDKGGRAAWLVYPPIHDEFDDIADPSFCYGDDRSNLSHLSRWKAKFKLPTIHFSEATEKAYPDLASWVQECGAPECVHVFADNDGGF